MNIFQHIQQIFSKKKGATILEIGAYRCDDTASIMVNTRSVLGKGEIQYFVFEPDPRNIPHIEKNPVVKYVTLIPMAIGAQNGSMTLYQSSGNINPAAESWTGSSSIRRPKNH